jgi:hypothetical protein
VHRLVKIIGIVLLVIVMNPVYGQKIDVNAGFMKDTIVIGEEIPYYLNATYPKNMVMVFPDSTFDFRPFEFNRKQYFRTKSDSTTSRDSVIYFLATFSLDTFQSLLLPVYIANGNDCTEVDGESDSIFLQHVISEMPDSVALKTNTSFFRIPSTFNYPLFTIAIITFGIIAFLVFLFFGKRIFRWVIIKQLKRRHKKFVEKFYLWLRDLRDNRNLLSAEQILNEWKKYLERLEKEPYTKMTSREIVAYTDHLEIRESLKNIDRFIYGDVKETPLHKEFEKLLDFSIDRYREKLVEYGHVE